MTTVYVRTEAPHILIEIQAPTTNEPRARQIDSPLSPYTPGGPTEWEWQSYRLKRKALKAARAAAAPLKLSNSYEVHFENKALKRRRRGSTGGSVKREFVNYLPEKEEKEDENG